MSQAGQRAKKLTVQLLLGGVLAGVVACASAPEVRPSSEVRTSEAPTDVMDSAISETVENPDVEPTVKASSAENIALEDASPDVDCDERQTQLAMNICSGRDHLAAHAELYQMYENLISEQSTAGAVALEEGDVAWLNFRDRDCEFSKSFYEGGSLAPLVFNGCMETKTVNRMAQLREPQAGNLSYAAADTDLNQTYQRLMDETRVARKEALIDAQLAWITYRDRHCAFEVEYQPVAISEDQCLARMTEIRLQQLEEHLETASM